jgi:hypothetical protein
MEHASEAIAARQRTMRSSGISAQARNSDEFARLAFSGASRRGCGAVRPAARRSLGNYLVGLGMSDCRTVLREPEISCGKRLFLRSRQKPAIHRIGDVVAEPQQRRDVQACDTTRIMYIVPMYRSDTSARATGAVQ